MGVLGESKCLFFFLSHLELSLLAMHIWLGNQNWV